MVKVDDIVELTRTLSLTGQTNTMHDSVIFVNENKNKNGEKQENNKFVNEI